ncbi:hypothetical protein ENBRE01_0269 [Enteropsectra breve]|nr:hypothetical protein ENBRE01_0269 [Enteropsectra breve]
MEEEYGVVQLPKDIKIEDLPADIEVDKIFEINGQRYVLTKEIERDMQICTEVDENKTDEPKPCQSYFIISKVM